MTDVSLRGKVHTDFIGRFLLSHYRAVLRYTPTQNFVYTGKKKVQLSLRQFERNTQIFNKNVWTLSTANFTKSGLEI
jgi:uncharacterized membrane protein